MNVYEDQLTAIRTILSDPNYEVQMEGYDLLFKLWLSQEEPNKFYGYLIPLALEHDNLLREFENWINHLVVQDSITDAHLRKLHRDLSTEVSRIRQENKEKEELNKVLKETIINETDAKQDDSPSISEFDANKLTKERDMFAVRFLFLPVGINALLSIIVHLVNRFLSGDGWRIWHTLIFFVSILFINILVTDYMGRKNPAISDWVYFKKFQLIKTWIVGSLLLLLGGLIIELLTNALSEYFKDAFKTGK